MIHNYKNINVTLTILSTVVLLLYKILWGQTRNQSVGMGIYNFNHTPDKNYKLLQNIALPEWYCGGLGRR